MYHDANQHDDRHVPGAFANLMCWVCGGRRYVRNRIGQALKLRLTPEVRFEHDDSLDELERVSGGVVVGGEGGG